MGVQLELLTIREEQRLRMFQSQLLKGILTWERWWM